MKESMTLVLALIVGLWGYFYSKHLFLVSLLLVYLYIAFPKFSHRISLWLHGLLNQVFKFLGALLLTLIFYLILTPMAFLYRLSDKKSIID